jgi:hypothetical protein
MVAENKNQGDETCLMNDEEMLFFIMLFMISMMSIPVSAVVVIRACL